MRVAVNEYGQVACTWFYAVEVPDDLDEAAALALAVELVESGQVDPFDSYFGDSTGEACEYTAQVSQ